MVMSFVNPPSLDVENTNMMINAVRDLSPNPTSKSQILFGE
jgi:hypothetical protein